MLAFSVKRRKYGTCAIFSRLLPGSDCRCGALPLCLLSARWRPPEGRLALRLRPPALAGLAEHVWTLREVLLFRVPPWPQPAEG